MNKIRYAPGLVISLFALLGGPVDAVITPPGPPSSGPGSAVYAHHSLTAHRYDKGEGEYWIFEPAEPALETAPVIVFMHGWSAMDPGVYGAWIEHLVRKGNIVIYPRFQASFRTPTKNFLPNALGAIHNALATLAREPGHAKSDLNQFIVMGHSVGAMIGTDLAASVGELPKPKALLAVEPGKSWGSGRDPYHFKDLSKIPSDMIIVTVVGDRDQTVRDIDAKRIMKETSQVPDANKTMVLFRSDFHGSPPLIANHFFPTSESITGLIPKPAHGGKLEGHLLLRWMIERRMKRTMEAQSRDTGLSGNELMKASEEAMGSVDALDTYGLWKLSDSVCDGLPLTSYMGTWSDGQLVLEPQMTHNP